MEEDVVSILLDVVGNECYQEVLAHELGVPDVGHVVASESSSHSLSLMFFNSLIGD
jgi:hypothetical protein